ncbi:MAG: DUF2799 domain-containing protein, partial [Gammaproteobacteria bacterium]|nr:DUF2799 domain-containing protein [Gammaproteobacteria bacterium]
MNSSKLFFLLMLPVVLSACATLSQTDCETANWQETGLRDGYNGRDTNYIQKHAQTCAEYGIKPDMEQYQSGYNAGLARFCTANKGYWLGETGQAFKDVCPDNLNADYLKGYEEGYR